MHHGRRLSHVRQLVSGFKLLAVCTDMAGNRDIDTLRCLLAKTKFTFFKGAIPILGVVFLRLKRVDMLKIIVGEIKTVCNLTANQKT